jgi:hypothetical protein
MTERELDAGRTRVRVVGEVDVGEDVAARAEWGTYEAVVNAVFATDPTLWTVCLFNTRDLPGQVLTAARLTHPTMLTATARTPNPSFIEPVRVRLWTTPDRVLCPRQQRGHHEYRWWRPWADQPGWSQPQNVGYARSTSPRPGRGHRTAIAARPEVNLSWPG